LARPSRARAARVLEPRARSDVIPARQARRQKGGMVRALRASHQSLIWREILEPVLGHQTVRAVDVETCPRPLSSSESEGRGGASPGKAHAVARAGIGELFCSDSAPSQCRRVIVQECCPPTRREPGRPGTSKGKSASRRRPVERDDHEPSAPGAAAPGATIVADRRRLDRRRGHDRPGRLRDAKRLGGQRIASSSSRRKNERQPSGFAGSVRGRGRRST